MYKALAVSVRGQCRGSLYRVNSLFTIFTVVVMVCCGPFDPSVNPVIIHTELVLYCNKLSLRSKNSLKRLEKCYENSLSKTFMIIEMEQPILEKSYISSLLRLNRIFK